MLLVINTILVCFCHAHRVIPQYLMYRPANSVPYATVETELMGDFQQYCTIDAKGKLITQTSSELEQKCSTFQHWIHQWTHGNLLVTRMEGRTQLQVHNQRNHMPICEICNNITSCYAFF